MKNLEALLGDVLEQTAGVRTTAPPDEIEMTPLQRVCHDAAALIYHDRDILLGKLLAAADALPDTTLLASVDIEQTIWTILQRHIEKSESNIPSQQQSTMKAFLPSGTQAVGMLAYELGREKTPDQFASGKPLVILASILMSRYPQEISANLKMLMANELGTVVDKGDITNQFRENAARILIDGISKRPKDLGNVKRLKHCPAWGNIDLFADAVFDLFAAAYKHVYEKHSDSSGGIAMEALLMARHQLMLKTGIL